MRISQPIVLPDGHTRRGWFDRLTIFFHWTSATLVAFLLASGWAMAELDALPVVPNLLVYHRSAGMILWATTVLRFLWRRTFATFPPFPSNMWRVTKWSAQATEYALYLMLFVQPLTGLAHTMLRGRPFELFIWSVPALAPRNLQLSEQLFALHSLGALAFAALVGMHAVAALGHHYIFRDDVLELMAPLLRRRARPRDLRDAAAARAAMAS